MQEMTDTWLQSLGVEDALEKEMATHSSLLAWEIPWTEELQSMESQKSQTRLSDWTATAPITFMQMVPVNFKTFVDQKEKKPHRYTVRKDLNFLLFTFSCRFYFFMQIFLMAFISKGNQQLHRKAHYTPWELSFQELGFEVQRLSLYLLKVMVRCLNCRYSCVITEFS